MKSGLLSCASQWLPSDEALCEGSFTWPLLWCYHYNAGDDDGDRGGGDDDYDVDDDAAADDGGVDDDDVECDDDDDLNDI